MSSKIEVGPLKPVIGTCYLYVVHDRARDCLTLDGETVRVIDFKARNAKKGAEVRAVVELKPGGRTYRASYRNLRELDASLSVGG